MSRTVPLFVHAPFPKTGGTFLWNNIHVPNIHFLGNVLIQDFVSGRSELNKMKSTDA
jgi:hypothetical protein